MEITQKYLQDLLDDVKSGGVTKISYEDLESRLEKTDLTPEQNAEIYRYLEQNGVKIVDTFDKDNSALYRNIGDVAPGCMALAFPQIWRHLSIIRCPGKLLFTNNRLLRSVQPSFVY